MQLLPLPFAAFAITFPLWWPNMTCDQSETSPPSEQRQSTASGISDRIGRMPSSRLENAETSEMTQKRLAEMGYEQELKRSLGMISILGLSFAIMAVPFVLPNCTPHALIKGTFDDVLHWVDGRWVGYDTLVHHLPEVG